MRIGSLGLLPALALVVGCAKEEPRQPAPTFHEVMKDRVDLRADVVWAVGNAAIGDHGGIDPAKMSDADWDKLAEGAESLRQAALEIATMDPVVLTRDGVKIADEDIPDGHSSADVQARFDREPQKLRELANALAAHNADLAAAARAHDAARAGPLIDQLDGVCESCHLEFWYPDQKELVEEILGRHA
jgi:hypothetical protein